MLADPTFCRTEPLVTLMGGVWAPYLIRSVAWKSKPWAASVPRMRENDTISAPRTVRNDSTHIRTPTRLANPLTTLERTTSILVWNNVRDVVAAIRLSRATMRKIKKSLSFGQSAGYHHATVKILLILGGAMLGAELAAMLLVSGLPWPAAGKVLLCTALLLTALLPVLHRVLFRPMIQDIEAGRTARIDLQDRIVLVRKVLDSAFDAIVVIDMRGIIQEFNPAAERIFERAATQTIGQNVKILMPEPYHGHHDDYIAEHLAIGTSKLIGVVRELIGQRSNGDVFPMELAVTEMQVRGQPAFVATVRDITERKRAEGALRRANETLESKVLERTAALAQANNSLGRERKMMQERLNAMATTDALTGILNRRQFDNLLNMELERARRYQSSFSLIMFDIDYFKQVNDNYGHLVGDTVLAELAQLVSAEVRVTDSFARWGGEEFILLVHGDADGGTPLVVEKLRTLIERHTFFHDKRLTCSFGVTACSGTDSFREVMWRVDQALYRAKENGRNRVEVG